MSSYYAHARSVQYKPKGKQYNRASTIISDDVADLKFNANSTKKMAYTVQKVAASSTPSTTYVTAEYLNDDTDSGIVTPTLKYEPATTPSKISTHLLDHGYGATPQPQIVPLDEAAFKGYTKTPDAGITHFYKVSDDILMTAQCYREIVIICCLICRRSNVASCLPRHRRACHRHRPNRQNTHQAKQSAHQRHPRHQRQRNVIQKAPGIFPSSHFLDIHDLIQHV